MSTSFRRILAFFLTLALFFQINTLQAQASDLVIIKEGKLEETLIREEFVDETLIEPEYIREHLICEDTIYQYWVNENLYSEAFLYEVTITPETITNLAAILPPQFDDYNIDWPSVIAKFAVGTSIIIAVGVINYLTSGTSTFFLMATPGSVAKDAFIGGAIGAALDIVIHDIKDNRLSDRAALKYAIEGFAEGYMWGAITSVLKVGVQNFKRLRQFKKATGEVLKIKFSGEVVNKSGETIGKAFYDSSKVWHLVDEASNTTTIFNSAGKELMTVAGTSLPANEVLRLGTDAAYHACYTDANGIIYRVDNSLKPNITYKLGDYSYYTDGKGRIIKVEFEQLRLKPVEEPRLIIADTMNSIGRNSAKLNDHRGHLIADRFYGDNTMANIVPQAATVNQGYVARIETRWAKALTNGQNVSGSIEISYKGQSFRPIGFNYKYDMGTGITESYIPNK